MEPDRQDVSAEPSVGTGLERVLLASQRVLFARLDLLLLEIHDAMTRTLRAVLLGGLAVGIGLGGWFAMLTGIILALGETIGKGPSLLLIGGLNFAIAITAILRLVRDSRKPPPVSAQVLPDVRSAVEPAVQGVAS